MDNTVAIVDKYLNYQLNLAKALLDEAIADRSRDFTQAYSEEIATITKFMELNGALKRRYEENTIELDEQIECQWCHEMFSKDDLRRETNMGYICDHCARALESRGEELIFIE